MYPVSRSIIVLLLSSMLQACGDDLTPADHVRNAETHLEQSRGQIVMIRLHIERAAIAELKAALKKDGNNPEINLFLGATYFDTGDWEDADAKLSKALTLGADASAVIPMLAQVLLSIGEFERLDSLPFDGLGPEDRSIVQAAKALSMIYREKPVLAAEIMDAALQNEPLSPFAEVAGARVAMEIDGYDEAQKQLRETISRFPEYAPAWNLLGDVESARGQPKAALKAYQSVIEFSGERFQALLNGALMRIYTGDFNRAHIDLNTAQTKYPSVLDHDGAQFARALVHLQKNSLYKARKAFLGSLETSDGYPLSLYYLAAIDLELGISDLEPGFSELALSRAYRFLGVVPDSLAGARLAAKIELGGRDYPKAEKLLLPLLARRPDDIESLILLARAQSGQGRNQEEVKLLAKVVALQPGSREARARLGAAYLEVGSNELGIEMQQDILSEDPDYKQADIPGYEQADRKKAEKLLLPELAKRPDELELLNLRAQLGEGRNPEGVETLTRAAELQSSSTGESERLGAAYPGVAAEELGIEILQNILSEDPGYEQADILIVLNALRQRRITDAVRAAQAYRKRNPSGATSYGLLARAYLANGERENAKAAFGNALELRPGDPDAGSGLAEFELLENDFDSARNYYYQILKHYPDHIPTWMKLATSFAEEGREQDMLDSLQSALTANPRATEPRLAEARYYLAKGQLEEAIFLLDYFTAAQKEQPDALATMAVWELATGRYDQALVTLRGLIRIRPNVSQYHYMRSKAYAGLGDKKRTIAELKRAAELDPNHFYAKIATARLELLSGQNDGFEKHLAELRAAAPDNPDVMKLEVVSAQRKGNSEAARRWLESLLQQQPTTDNVIALAAHQQLHGDFEGAIERLQSWIKGHPNDVKVREKLAEVYGRSNRVGAAVSEYRKILQGAPKHGTALNNLAWHLLEDDPEEALGYAERAIRLFPDSSPILDTLAMTQLKNDRIREARRSIDRARTLAPASPEVLFHEAQIMVAEGDASGAIDTLHALLAKREKFSGRTEAEVFLNQLK